MNGTIPSCLIVWLLWGVSGCRPDNPPGPQQPENIAHSSAATTPPEQLTLDLGGSQKMTLALIPAGTFRMGSTDGDRDHESDEVPTRTVSLTKPFYLGIYEVTQEQYQAVTGRNPSRFKGPRRPVEGIWWSDAAAFCEIVSRQTGRAVHLPSEAQWEYAARATGAGRFSFGDRYEDLPRYAYYNRISDAMTAASSPSATGTVTVGSFEPNRWGLYDMYGNVFEWCNDWYRDSYRGLAGRDPIGAPSGAYRVLRGGSWASPPWQCRSAYRHRFTADGRFNHLIGFRVAADVP